MYNLSIYLSIEWAIATYPYFEFILGKIIACILFIILMGSVWRGFADAMSWFFDILPGVGLIPDRIRKILAGTCFVPGAILASIGWATDQACTFCSGSTSDGFLELLMMIFGVFLMYISLCLWPWGSYEEEIINL